MQAEFIAANPQERAITVLHEILEQGVDQISIACAFLTAGGAKFLERHVERLRLPESFLVVAWGTPTDEEALEKLHKLAPGHIYYHLGSQLPYETGVGSGLMHSKVFFARAGRQCWLWTGSHNLTASALQGVNREAAILLTGTVDELPFQSALQHLQQCKAEAKVFDPANPPPALRPEQTLVVHAECSIELKPLPWHVHLRPASTAYDKEMRPPGAVWLYLHMKNALRRYGSRPLAETAYSGTLTALNFTEYHPQRGIPANWQGADYVIEQNNGIFQLVAQEVGATNTPSQAVFRIDSVEEPTTVWVSDSPNPRRERRPGPTRLSQTDPDFLQFFTPRSVKGGQLVHRDYDAIHDVVRMRRTEVGDMAEADLLPRVSYSANRLTGLEIAEVSKGDERSAFIYRAKFRL
ncbi:hypothetical protein [Massilia rubra]|uniref:Phospholipase D-like domain-containing protein n=1 Tax=Massilia rubra TaxID=2607910 RepID=A0ABX0M6N5_9BURK|nr:hypothetical protein [Massilia rubra]NHZ37851.1 hypothetical protein [Massilia rubra]